MKLIKGTEKDLYRVYKDSENIYYHFTGKKMDLKFKSKRWDKPIEMRVGHFPTKNFKILK